MGGQNGVIPYGPSKRFHEISLFPLHQGQYNENIMGDYIWGLSRGSDLQYTRKSPCHLVLSFMSLWGTTFGGFLEKAICSTLANLENIIISEPLWVIIVCLCLFTMQVLFLSDCMNDNIKISLFCHNKYEFFCAVVIKSKFVLTFL